MDVETRWNSTFNMIESVLASKEAISQILIRDKMYRHLILSAAEITLLEEIRDILRPWKELTVRLSNEKEVTISLVAPTVHRLLTYELQRKDMDSELGIQMKAAMRQDLSKRYQDGDVKAFLHIPSLLDPRFKSLLFLCCEEKEAAYTDPEARAVQIEERRVQMQAIKKEKMTVESAPPLPTLVGNEVTTAAVTAAAACKEEIPSSSSSPPVKRRKASQDTFFDDFFGDLIITKIKKSPECHERFQKELKMYLSLDSVVSKFVLDWWKTNSSQFPLLANVAKQASLHPCYIYSFRKSFQQSWQSYYC